MNSTQDLEYTKDTDLESTSLEEFENIEDLSVLDKLRNNIFYQMGIFTLASAGALLASFVLSVDAIARYINPNVILPCDVNSKLSCSEVAKSWQATLLSFGDVPLPNSFIGMVAETVFVSIGVVLLSKGTIAKWINYGMFLGVLGSTIFAYWLFSQEVWVLNVLCPWCLLLLFTQTVMFSTWWRYASMQDVLPFPKNFREVFRKWSEKVYGTFFSILWVLFVIAFIIVHYGADLFK